MTRTSPTEAPDLVAAVQGMKGGLTLVASESRLHTEILTRIVELLTPSDERSGPPIHELLAALIGRLDRQSVMLKEIIEDQGSLRRDLPQQVVRAIDEAHDPADGPASRALGEEQAATAANGLNGAHHP